MSPAPPAAHAAARSALSALISSGLSLDDPRLQTLQTLISLTAGPPPPLPPPPPSTPANPHTRPAPALTKSASHNTRTIVAARLAAEGAYAAPPSPPPPPTHPLPSAFAAAATRPPKKHKDPGTSPRRAARPLAEPPALGLPLAPHVPAAALFQLRAQLAAYRRVLRGAALPKELRAASGGGGGGSGAGRRSVLPGPVVERAVQLWEEGVATARPELQAPDHLRFDVRRLPIMPKDHCFTREDVVEAGEDVGEAEVSERVLMAEARHRRLYAWGKNGTETELEPPQLDPRVAQQRAEIIHATLTAVGGRANAEVETKETNTAKATADGKRVMKGEKRRAPGDEMAVLRERAAVAISVVTKSTFAPSLQTLKKERGTRIVMRVQARLQEISDLPPTVSEDVKRAADLEAKGLKLIPLQRSVRRKVRKTMHRVLRRNGLANLELHTGGKFRRKSFTSGYASGPGAGERPHGQRDNVNHRMEQEARRRTRRLNMMNNLLTHAQEFRAFSHSRVLLHKRLLKDLERYFRDRSREEERRKKKEQMERLRALRNNNEDEYLELLKTTKNKRLIQLLKQTDEYLMQIGAQVERQKEAARKEDREAEGAAPNDDAQDGQHAEATDQATQKEGDDELLQLKKRRNDYYTITHTISERVYQPECLVGGKLKPYQVEGLEWLVSLFNNNLNGILADEMGLGKTIQTLSLITFLVEVKRVSGPFLIIVPLSVMSNWVREMELWAPSLVKIVYRGDPATRKNIQMYEMQGGNYNVLLTTYEFVVKDKNILGKIRWKYIIMDEGHRMKNADCKLALTLGAKYTSRNRLLLTGTPLQNNMTELWALLNFLLPSIFSSAETFETWFNAPFQASALGDTAELNEEENLLIISRLHQVLRPFMLRRLKTDVEAQLPDKVETVFRCEMSVWQRVLYRQMRAKLGISAGAGSINHRSFNNMVMQLKKVCNHPFLFYSEEELMSIPSEFLIRASGKFELLEHSLRKLHRSGHRVLMFSQMTAALDYLEYFLNTIGMKNLRLDGTTKADDRQEMLELFNAKDSEYFCFLLSTRAGGLGLNLQTADTVIIFDSDWNPMMDLQAQDRAHRIGQTKEVRVFRLICSGSIEVKILERANRKLQIDAQVIQAGQFNNKSSDNDRQEMLKDLLRQQGGDEPAANLDVTPLTEINTKLARTEEEFEMFEEMDAQAAAAREGRSRLVVDENELPAWVLQPEIDEKQKKLEAADSKVDFGRGRRKRKQVVYDDNLTEREWTTAMEEEGDVGEAVRRKRRRLTCNNSDAGTSSGEDDGQQAPEKDLTVLGPGPDKNGPTKEGRSPELAEDDSKSDVYPQSSVSQLEPFFDPELNKEPKARRKRGRPRKEVEL